METRIKSLLPPLCSKWYRNHLYRRGVKKGILAEIRGDYASFHDAAKDSGTYNSDSYAEHCFEVYKEVCEKQEPFLIKPHDWRLLSKVALAMGRPEGLRVLDVGGGCGDYYFKLKSLVGKEVIKRWVIVEAKRVAEKMKGIDPFLEYASSLEEMARQNLDINFVFISGTLQYLENPFQFLESLNPLKSEFLCINKSILWNKPTKIMKQISPGKPRASRPVWIFNEASLKDKLEGLNYNHLWAYENSELVTYIPGHGSLAYRGLFFKRNEGTVEKWPSALLPANSRSSRTTPVRSGRSLAGA